MAKKSKSNNQSKETDEKTVPCNLDNSFSIPEELADDLVIFRMTDYSSPQDKDVTKEKNFHKSVKRMNEAAFVQHFKSNFQNNGVFENVNSAEKIYRIMKNIDEKMVEERYEHALEGTRGKAASVKKDRIKRLLERAQELRLNGGNQVVRLQDFIHVPGLEDADKMPEDV